MEAARQILQRGLMHVFRLDQQPLNIINLQHCKYYH